MLKVVKLNCLSVYNICCVSVKVAKIHVDVFVIVQSVDINIMVYLLYL